MCGCLNDTSRDDCPCDKFCSGSTSMSDGPGKHEGWDAQWSREHLDERLTRQHLIAESVGWDAQPARLDCTYDNTFRRLGCTAVRAIGCKRPLIVVIRLLLGDRTLQSGGSKRLSTSQTLHRNSPHNCSEVHVSREAGGGAGRKSASFEPPPAPLYYVRTRRSRHA